MGTIVSSLLDRIARARGQQQRCAVTLTGFGFAVGGRIVAWQGVCEIWTCKVALADSDEAFLEFVVGADRLAIGEGQPGFDPLAAAMAAVFPSTADWRNRALQAPSARSRTLLYRRA